MTNYEMKVCIIPTDDIMTIPAMSVKDYINLKLKEAGFNLCEDYHTIEDASKMVTVYTQPMIPFEKSEPWKTPVGE